MAGGILLAILLIVLTFGRYRKEAATEVASKEAYLAEAQRLSHTGSFGWSAASGFVWSDETFRIFELDRATAPTVEAVIQRTHPEDRERVQRFIERASRDGGDWDVEHRLLMPDGAVKSLHVVVHAVRDEAGVLSFVGAVMDITAAKRAEEAVQAAQAELAHVSRMTTLGELTAWIAHEVNQPLAGIVTNGTACLQWLGQKNPALDEARSSVEDMISDAQRRRRHPRIRALSRKTAPKRAPLDINDLIQGVVRLVAREAQAHGASVRLDLAPALPAVVGDRVQLQQVVINLVINAIQAMASVTARPRELSIRSRQNEAGHVLIEVADSGHGIGSNNVDQAVQSLLHDQARRHGDGTVDLPLDHRSAWRQRMGDGQHAQRRRLPFHAAGGMKAGIGKSGRRSIRRLSHRLLQRIGVRPAAFAHALAGCREDRVSRLLKLAFSLDLYSLWWRRRVGLDGFGSV